MPSGIRENNTARTQREIIHKDDEVDIFFDRFLAGKSATHLSKERALSQNRAVHRPYERDGLVKTCVEQTLTQTLTHTINPTNLNSLILLQKRIIIIVSKKPFDAQNDPLFRDLKFLKIFILCT